jgi:hypothetical protein
MKKFTPIVKKFYKVLQVEDEFDLEQDGSHDITWNGCVFWRET